MKIEAKEMSADDLERCYKVADSVWRQSSDDADRMLAHIAWQSLRLIEARADRDAHAVRAQEQTERVSALEVERDLLRAQNAAMLDTLGKLEKQVAEAIFGLGVSS